MEPGAATASPDCMLRVAGLTKRFGDVLAVDRLGLEVRRGELLGFLGPNGAGKTTTLRMMCGLLRPDEGTVEIGGEALGAGRARGPAAVGVAPQEIVIWEALTCREQLRFMGQAYGLARRRADERARTLLAAFGLEEKADRLGRTLSGGMQRRLNIALGLVHEPELLFLDEPQAGLDPQSRVLVRDFVRSLKGRTTVVLTTHDMEEAEKLSDRVCIVDRGRVLALDTVAGVKRQAGESGLTEVEVDADVAQALVPHLARLGPGCALLARGRTLGLSCPDVAAALAEVLAEVHLRGLRLLGVRSREATLEDVFIKLTGRGLRE